MSRSDHETIGHHLTLRSVRTDDAEYIWGLRNDATYNTHLSAMTGTVADQRAWIERYEEREEAGTEYYFIVFRNADDRRCGTVRLYDIHDGRFTWGSWILGENKPPKAALDSAMQVYRFGFETLGLPLSVFDVRRDNANTLRFHDRFGAERTGEDGQNVYYELSRERFRELRPGFEKILAGS